MKMRGSGLRQGVLERMGLHAPGTCPGQQGMHGNLNLSGGGRSGQEKERAGEGGEGVGEKMNCSGRNRGNDGS